MTHQSEPKMAPVKTRTMIRSAASITTRKFHSTTSLAAIAVHSPSARTAPPAAKAESDAMLKRRASQTQRRAGTQHAMVGNIPSITAHTVSPTSSGAPT